MTSSRARAPFASWRVLLLLLGLGALTVSTVSAETIPPPPKTHFSDSTGRISSSVARQLDQQLVAYERESSNQLLVAISKHMDSASSVQDYTYRVAQSWKVGQADRRNGAVLFVFLDDRQIYLQVGYGLEGVIPDVTAKRLIEEQIAPRFRTGDYDGGMRAAVDAMIAASKGEYRGTGRTVADNKRRNRSGGGVVLFIILIIVSSIFNRRRNRVVIGGGRSTGWWIGGGGGGFGGGGGGGGGGFSGGGGSFGGGGAGGRW